MHPANQETLKQRAIRAAEAALADHQYVSPIDVLTGMNLLSPSNVEAWRKGRLDFLERMIQGSPEKISFSLKTFREWALAKGLKPSETRYVGRSREGIRDLRFTVGGDPPIEKVFRTHFVSPELSERKQEKLKERIEKPPQPVVFEILKDSQCTECGVELPKDSLLSMEGGQPLCLACVKMDDLEYLPAGDTALTRRATKYSPRTAVIVRFSRSRGRYERQGILVDKAALEKAEQECTEDSEARTKARARAADARVEQDRKLVERMIEQLLVLFPGCPPDEAQAIAAHTAKRGSGRVGRTAAGQKLEEQALSAAVTAAVRHRKTNYDELLASGWDRADARHKVADRVHEILNSWR